MLKESKTAIFNFEKCDEDLVSVLSTYLDEHVKRVYDFFEVEEPKEKIVINIIPTKKEYDENFRKVRGLGEDCPVFGWSVGEYRNGKITYLSLHDYKHTTHKLKNVEFEKAIDHYKKTIVHEYVHYVNDIFRKVKNCGSTEKYLSEGIACYLSGQKDGENIPFNFTCEQLLDRDYNNYDAYYLVTKYFVENYDKNFVLEIFQSNRQTRELLKNELFEKAENFYKSNEKEKS